MPLSIEETYNVPVITNAGSLITSVVTLQNDDKRQKYEVTCLLADGRSFTGEDWNYWPAFLQLRGTMETFGLRLKCYGSCENMVLSHMCMDMGEGQIGYLVKLGEPAKTESLTPIFSTAEEIIPVNITLQLQFEARWKQSLDSH